MPAFRGGPFIAFGVPAFRYLWGNTLLFMLVQSTQRFTFVWLVLELGHDSAASGLVLFALGLPVLFVSMPAGALADRMDRRNLMAISQAGALAVTVATAVLVATDAVGVSVAVVLASLLGVTLAAGQPVRMSVLPAVVDREILLRAIVMFTIGMNIALIVGPAIGGAAIAAWGLAGAFFVQAALYGIGLLFLIPLRVPPIPTKVDAAPQGVKAQIHEGVSFVVGRSDLRTLFVLVTAMSLTMVGPYLALLPEVARDELGADAFEASMLFAVLGVGLLVGSMYLAVRGDLPAKGAILAAALGVAGLVQVGMGLSPWYGVTAGLMLLWGICGGFFMNLNQSLVQTHTPDDKMGRVMSLHSLATQGLGPLGALLGGAVAAGIGTPLAVAVCGTAMTAVTLSMLARQPAFRALS